jgi:cytochrome d ubiquinol oxidase subunit I
MRVMAYLGGLLLLLGLWGFWRRRTLVESPWLLRIAIWALPVPFVINTAGWLLTENGRQPWIVQGLQLTRNAVSPSISTAEVALSFVVFLLLYAVLAILDFVLLTRFARKAISPPPAEAGADGDPGDREPAPEPAFTY